MLRALFDTLHACWRATDAFGLLRDESASRLQAGWRTAVARREAQKGLQLLREWDALVAEIALAKARRAAAAVTIQRVTRRFTRRRWVRFWSAALNGDASDALEKTGTLDSEENPFSDEFVVRRSRRALADSKLLHRWRGPLSPALTALHDALRSRRPHIALRALRLPLAPSACAFRLCLPLAPYTCALRLRLPLAPSTCAFRLRLPLAPSTASFH
jgi:hypothetical protein